MVRRAEEAWLAVDGQVEVAGDDEDSLTGQATVDSDDVVAPADVAGFVDAVHAGAYWSGDGWTGRGWWACAANVRRGSGRARALCGRAWL